MGLSVSLCYLVSKLFLQRCSSLGHFSCEKTLFFKKAPRLTSLHDSSLCSYVPCVYGFLRPARMKQLLCPDPSHSLALTSPPFLHSTDHSLTALHRSASIWDRCYDLQIKTLRKKHGTWISWDCTFNKGARIWDLSDIFQILFFMPLFQLMSMGTWISLDLVPPTRNISNQFTLHTWCYTLSLSENITSELIILILLNTCLRKTAQILILHFNIFCLSIDRSACLSFRRYTEKTNGWENGLWSQKPRGKVLMFLGRGHWKMLLISRPKFHLKRISILLDCENTVR